LSKLAPIYAWKYYPQRPALNLKWYIDFANRTGLRLFPRARSRSIEGYVYYES
jgi:hypothetical protein